MNNERTLFPGARLTAVRLRNGQGEEIGDVKEWMMDVERGQVVYVVAELEGTDGLVAIPWQMMRADPSRHGYVVDKDKILTDGVRVDREKLSDLVDDRSFFPNLLKAYGIEVPAQSGSPGGANESRPRSAEETGPSNAWMSEGKGY